VAALEAKIQQYERDVDHLKRALERSDQYIDDLEAQARRSKKRPTEVQEACGNSTSVTEALTQQQKINMMMRSLSDNERRLICSNPEAESRTFSRNNSVGSLPSAETEFDKNPTEEQKNEDSEGTSSDFLPTTPSTAFRSLTLRSPGIREKKVAFKPSSYLRRLDFEEHPSPGKTSAAFENKFSSLEKFPKNFPPDDTESSKSVFWGCWANSVDPSCAGPSKESSVEESTSTDLAMDKPDSFQTSSEASMDAAYLDKISELDSMMLDGESSSSRGSQLSLGSSSLIELDSTLVPEPQTCPDVFSSPDAKGAVEDEHKNQQACDKMDGTLNVEEAPEGSAEEGFAAQVLGQKEDAHVSDSAEREALSETEELSFDLLFDPLDEIKAGPSDSLSPTSEHHHQDHVKPSSSSSSGCTGSKPVNTRERHALNSSQPIKRKSHSPFNTSSPTKLSKLM